MSRKPRKIGVIDAETDPFKCGRIPQAFCWGFYREMNDGSIKYDYVWGEDCTKQLLDLISGYDGIIYAHNGGKFDFYYLLNEFQDFNWPISTNLIKSRIAKLKWGPTEFRDSYLIIPTALKSTGNKGEIDYRNFERNVRDRFRNQILDYLEQDCVATYNVVKSFINRFGIGLTLSNRSFSEMEKLNIKINNSSEYRDNIYRDWFFGGRCQCFQTGSFKGDLTILDINSAYPYAMLQDHFWGTSCDTLGDVSEWNLRDRFKYEKSLMLVDCYAYGCFPTRKKDGSIQYIEGRNKYKVTGWEFYAALDLGLIYDWNVDLAMIPHETGNFKPFVEKFYCEKLAAEKSGDKESRLFAKLMMNSGFGRFAMNPDSWSEHAISFVGDGPPEISDKDKNQNEWDLSVRLEDAGFDVYEREVAESQKRYYNVATAASITGYVRAMLMRSIQKTADPIYCDTDSIIFSGNHSLNTGENLGEWDIEAVGGEFHLAGKKLYAFGKSDGDWKIASKGVNLTIDPPGEFKNSEDRAKAGRKKASEIIKKIVDGNEFFYQSPSYNFSMLGKSRFVERTIKKTS